MARRPWCFLFTPHVWSVWQLSRDGRSQSRECGACGLREVRRLDA